MPTYYAFDTLHTLTTATTATLRQIKRMVVESSKALNKPKEAQIIAN